MPKFNEDGVVIFPCLLPDEEEAELHIHATDEGLVFDVWDKAGEQLLKSGYMFIDDILEHTH